MEQAIQDLYNELLRLKAKGIQSLYVDSQSIMALEAACNLQPQQSDAPLPVQSECTRIAKHMTVDLSPTSESHTQESQNQPINIQLPDGTRHEQLQWLEQQYFETFNRLQPKSYLFGSGGAQADILVCRYQGDTEGKKSQQMALLAKVFKAMELGEQSIYTTHLVKSALNMDPIAPIAVKQAQVFNEHRPFFMAQIECIQPKILLILGKASHDVLLAHDPEKTFAKDRGQWRYLNQFPVITSYDPSYLLQNDTLETKRQFWEDMLKILKKLGKPISNKQSNYFLPRAQG